MQQVSVSVSALTVPAMLAELAHQYLDVYADSGHDIISCPDLWGLYSATTYPVLSVYTGSIVLPN